MDIQSAYREVGTYRGAAEICSTTPKTVKRVIEAQERIGDLPAVAHNYDQVRELVAARVKKTKARISAKRLLPAARAAGYLGSPRNFRRLVADEKAAWRADHHRGRRPGVWEPGDMLVIDWGAIGPLHVFCAVLAFSRVRFVWFSDNERSETTLACLARCLEYLGGVPKTVLADRMGCLKTRSPIRQLKELNRGNSNPGSRRRIVVARGLERGCMRFDQWPSSSPRLWPPGAS